MDQERDELYFPGISYDDPFHEHHVKNIRFSPDEVVAGKVIRSGEPVIINDISTEDAYRLRDQKLGYITRSLVEAPIFLEDRVIGVLTGINKKSGPFSERDVDVLTTLAGTVALAIENTHYQEELRQAYREVRSLNIAKDKGINHLSHELKTPVAILSEAVSCLKDELQVLPEEDWKPFSEMVDRQLKRISEIKEEVSDIIAENDLITPSTLSWLVDQCGDLLATLAVTQKNKTDILAAIKYQIRTIFSPEDQVPVPVNLTLFIENRLPQLKQQFAHRDVVLTTRLEPTRPILIPEVILGKIVDGLVRNGVENTPDEGRVEVSVWEKGKGVFLAVKDTGVGIIKDHRNRIFEGLFPTQDMATYSTRKPFDFDAGGRGADLLRMKIFSETYKFTIDMASMRCPYLEETQKRCPGRTSVCTDADQDHPCSSTGGTEFILRFSPVTEDGSC
jgi:signal transduction histidine kinase